MNLDTVWTDFEAYLALIDWTGIWEKFFSIVAIIVIAFGVRWVLQFVIRRVVQQIVSGVKKNQKVEDTQALNVSPLAAVRVVQRSRTLGSVLANIVNVFILITAILMIVDRLSPNILGSFALLTAAIGAGLGFGAQNIVKDILNGLFMVVEDQIGVGDIVDVGFASGVVETVGIRITQVRDIDGTLWFVRNGEILRVGNIPYSSDVEAVQAELLRVATALASSRKWRSIILEKPEIWGLESISAEALVTRLVVKTRVSAKWDFARDLRLHLKKALDGVGVSLTPLNSVIMTGPDGAIESGADFDPSADAIDAAEEAAAAVPDPTSPGHTAPVPVRRQPRGPRKPKSAPATTALPVPPAPVSPPPTPPAPSRPLPLVTSAPDPQTQGGGD